MEGKVQHPINARAALELVPPEGYFILSALFHYRGPAFAVLLFSHIALPGVARQRIASAAVILTIWKRPWNAFKQLDAGDQRNVLTLGITLAAMNTVFYLALEDLRSPRSRPSNSAGRSGSRRAGARSVRNRIALLLAVSCVCVLTDLRIDGAPAAYG